MSQRLVVFSVAVMGLGPDVYFYLSSRMRLGCFRPKVRATPALSHHIPEGLGAISVPIVEEPL